MDVTHIHEGNRDAWNRTALGGYGSEIDAHVYLLRDGRTSFSEAERELLGDLRGRCQRAIHLQCSHGLDSLSLLNIGADEVVGIDISEEMLTCAGEKSAMLGANAQWIRSVIVAAPSDLNETADLVYTGKGAICWMMDLDAWAAVVWRLLKPGGTLFLYEGHPLDFVWEEEESSFVLRDGAAYFTGQPSPELGFPYGAALRYDSTKPVILTSRVWTIGETVTAVASAGLRITRLEEFADPFWDQFKHIPTAEFARLPHTFALVATKPIADY